MTCFLMLCCLACKSEPENWHICVKKCLIYLLTHIFTHKCFSLFYFRPNMVFLGTLSLPDQKILTYIWRDRGDAVVDRANETLELKQVIQVWKVRLQILGIASAGLWLLQVFSYTYQWMKLG